MLTLLIFLLWLTLLSFEGWLIAGFVVAKMDQWLRGSLALPFAAIANVLVIFVFTVLGVPLALLTLGAAHIAIAAVLFIISRKSGILYAGERDMELRPWTKKQKILGLVCSILLANAFIFSAVHSVVLPSLSIDIFTNWTMRSKVSWSDRAIAFDRSEARGVAKPQYPFLVHGLQIAVNEGNQIWSDRAANTVTWLLTISSFAAAFLVLRKLRGTFMALCTLSAMALIPMMTIHLSAGYGDIHLITYGLLSFLALAVAVEHDKRWLAFSAVMVLGALWSKSEGLYFVFIPWVCALVILGWKQELSKSSLVKNILISCLPFLPFLAFLILKGLSLTPHESDGTFGIKWEGFSALPHALFGSGSFGVLWYALIIVIIGILLRNKKNPSLLPGTWYFALLLMALLSLLGVLFVYLFTPNVGFLLNGQSFYRQMLLPAAMLISWIAISLPRTSSSTMVESD